LQGGRQGLFREREDLLQAQDRHVLHPLLPPFRQQIVIDLAGADHHTLDLLRRHQRIQLIQHEAEMAALGHVGQAADRELVPQQRLRRHNDQRLAEVALQLPAQGVEVVGWRG